jgi:glycerol uptake facilitator-like aquaporin
MLKKAAQFLHHVLPSILKPLRVLWNEIIGFAFLIFAVLAAFRVYNFLRDFDGSADAIFGVTISAAFCILMAYFGFSSFWRARKISRS